MFVLVPRAQLVRVRRALAKLEGLPVRGVVVGGPDVLGDQPGAGWTTETLHDADVDDDGSTNACVDLPARLEKWCGQTVTVQGVEVTLPTLAQLKADVNALPAALRTARAARLAAAQLPVTT